MIISNAPFMAGLNCETMTAERRMGRVLVQGGFCHCFLQTCRINE